MSTVEKALSVLDLFSENQPRWRTSEIARELRWDKSTVQRYVNGLASRGLLEQDSRDKSYTLGAALTRLAMLRERTNPVAEEVQSILAELVDKTGETAHASEYINGQLMTTAIVETNIRGTRVYIDAAEPLPLHASGSGIAFLSALSDGRAKLLLGAKLQKFTEYTETRKTKILSLVREAAANGFAKNEGTFESDVIGLAAPVLGFDEKAVGAVAVATPAARFNLMVERRIAGDVKNAAVKLSRLYGASGVAGWYRTGIRNGSSD